MTYKQQWWMQRTDAEVAEAYVHIDEYEAEAQEIIRSEYARRDLERMGPLPPTRQELRDMVMDRSVAAVQTYLSPTEPVALIRLIGMGCLVSCVGRFVAFASDLQTARDFPDGVSVTMAVVSTVVFLWALWSVIAAFRPTPRAWTILTSYLTWSVVSIATQTTLWLGRLALESISQAEIVPIPGMEDTSINSIQRIGISLFFGAFWLISCANMLRPDIQEYMQVSPLRRMMTVMLMKHIAAVNVVLVFFLIWLLRH